MRPDVVRDPSMVSGTISPGRKVWSTEGQSRLDTHNGLSKCPDNAEIGCVRAQAANDTDICGKNEHKGL